jgi:hypothetical protein
VPKRISEPPDAGVPPPYAPTAPSWYRRTPWAPLVVTLAVLLSGGAAVEPVRDAATFADVTEASLVRPLGYVVMAPISNVLDTLTLLSLRQHIALVLGILVLALCWRIALRWLGAVRPTPRGHLVSLLTIVVVILAAYAGSALLPRPMAALVSNNPNILRVDFHSHTRASHDGHQSARQLRAWHAKAGYDAAYITDHGTVAEAERGIAANPGTAANDVMLLQGIEVTWNGEHVTILGAERFYRGLLTDTKRDIDARGLELGSLVTGREPVVIWNHPHQLDRLPLASGPGTAGIRAIEIVNGAPDDRDESRRNHRAAVDLAQRNNLALTIGSDNHGWGYATPGWTLMRIFNWRSYSGDDLAMRIEQALREGGLGSTRTVERRIANPETGAALLLSTFSVPARLLTTISSDERIAWLVWTWLIAAGVWWYRRRNRTARETLSS